MKPSKRSSHCNKKKFDSLLTAQIVLDKMSRKKRDPIVSFLDAYKCQYCDGYHVGRSNRGVNWDRIEREENKRKERIAGWKTSNSTKVTEPGSTLEIIKVS